MTLASDAVDALRSAGHVVATAESLTGGLLCSTLIDVPGASDVVAGGIVAYAPQVKIDLLGVGADVIAEHGTVDPTTAAQMALGAVEQVSGATIAISTTGVAGPDPSEGKPVGTAFIAIATAGEAEVLALNLSGDRRSVREQVVAAALSAMVARLGEESRSDRG